MSIQNEKELQGILKAGKFVALVRDVLVQLVRPGISTKELDSVAEGYFHKFGAMSAPKFDYNFPGFTCISVNEEAAHGIPSETKILQEGDLVNIDVSGKLDGFYADCGISITVGTSQKERVHLCQAAKNSTLAGISQAKTGNYLRNIGKAMHLSAKNDGYTMIKNLAGHGTGRKLHEPPQVLPYEDKKETFKLNEGLVLAIESFVSTGAHYVYEMNDGWTLKTRDGSFVTQFEHTVIVTKNGAIIATK
ncbi:methionine aminopeptidase 2 [Leptospira kobayashii]|uniref:Methionine aminopeptidase n=1 Tax=Leptospira kobayashii TaxID=1917830 RepID=A0ABN6KFS4_9LEPT|nr:type I methionyl aminopeptidase [Leptospira kobayashii]BDA79269.1 methionine aminopeptidase 2 [Leptospira kobayashii]